MTIEICTKCDGTGQLTYDIGTHNSEYETDECDKCEGSGRLRQETHVTYEPFKPGPNESKRIF